MAAALLA
ncbi:hypothetical protein MKD33_04445, partial [Chromobacterium piscinae]